MFPEFTYTDTTEHTDTRRSVVFDSVEKRFRMVDGAAQECTGVDAVKQWCALLLHTKRGRYAVYGDTAFGITVDDIIGSRTMPDAFVWSELKREIMEGLALCPAIERADGFSFVRNRRTVDIRFMVYLRDGTQTEVQTNVG